MNGIIIVDHGSRLGESNALLERVAEAFARRFPERFPIVEPAHMELAEPTIAQAYGACAARGARHIVVCPYFLGPGKHWTQDIPRLTAEAQAQHPGTTFHITESLGLDDLMLDLIAKRIGDCERQGFSCPRCEGTVRRGCDAGERPGGAAGV